MIDKARLAELRAWLQRLRRWMRKLIPSNVDAYDDLLSILADYEDAMPLIEAATGPCENRITYGKRVYDAASDLRKKLNEKKEPPR